MESFLNSCVEKYCELAKIKRESRKKVNTPFIDEAIADKEWEKTVDNQIKDGKLDEKTNTCV
jgi:predicted AAA+ superfamily ATPase